MFHDSLTTDAAWAGRSYKEIRECAEESGSIAVVPVGSVEQHGHHLPTGTDTILADAVAHGAAAGCEALPLLITPPVWAGHSDHHLSFGGTITQSTAQLTEQLVRIGKSILENEFDLVLFLNGHGGNAAVISNATREIGTQYRDREVSALTYYTLADSFIDDVRESDTGGINHGGEFETSLMIHIAPELVSEEEIDGTVRDEAYDRAAQDLFKPGDLTVYRSIDEFTDSGAIGSPELASEAKGAEIYDRLCEELQLLFREMHSQNR